MAGMHSRAVLAPTFPDSPTQAARLVPGPSRTRRLHAAFAWGCAAGAVYSTRRQAEGCAVILHALPLDASATECRLTAAQARELANALHLAAATAELAEKGAA
jgi:hypothetical protein